MWTDQTELRVNLRTSEKSRGLSNPDVKGISGYRTAYDCQYKIKGQKIDSGKLFVPGLTVPLSEMW